MPHDMEWELAEEICKRYPVEMVRLARAARKHDARLPHRSRRNRPRKDPLSLKVRTTDCTTRRLVSVKPKAEDWGDPKLRIPCRAARHTESGGRQCRRCQLQ